MTDIGWRFYVDRGGTFTDIVAQTPDGRPYRAVRASEDLSFDPPAKAAGEAPSPGPPPDKGWQSEQEPEPLRLSDLGHTFLRRSA